MSILIKSMEMPTKCADCLFIDYFKGQWYCHSINDILETGSSKRDERCNLIPVPPHGDLIEESKVLDIVYEWCPDDDGSVGKDGDLREMLDEIEALPTIIPAEEE